jgi:uncharacterized damage-inducible protein DinB
LDSGELLPAPGSGANLKDMDALRKQLVESMAGGHAHATFEDAVKNLAAELRGKKPHGSPHSAWQLLEHLHVAQHDILEFSRDPDYVSPKWPEGYWPKEAEPPTDSAWDQSIARFEEDQKAFGKLISDPALDLFAKLAHGDGQTLLHEALLIIDHNAYHVGQIVQLRVQLGAWPRA